jgi:hypothetical protein
LNDLHGVSIFLEVEVHLRSKLVAVKDYCFNHTFLCSEQSWNFNVALLELLCLTFKLIDSFENFCFLALKVVQLGRNSIKLCRLHH